jgi:hypothetical protein
LQNVVFAFPVLITFCYDGDDDDVSHAACDNGDCHENNDDALEIKKLLCDDGHCDLLAE